MQALNRVVAVGTTRFVRLSELEARDPRRLHFVTPQRKFARVLWKPMVIKNREHFKKPVLLVCIVFAFIAET